MKQKIIPFELACSPEQTVSHKMVVKGTEFPVGGIRMIRAHDYYYPVINPYKTGAVGEEITVITYAPRLRCLMVNDSQAANVKGGTSIVSWYPSGNNCFNYYGHNQMIQLGIAVEDYAADGSMSVVIAFDSNLHHTIRRNI